MKLLFMAGFILGSLLVFQPALNRLILEEKGLSFAALLNGIILFLATTSLFLIISSSAYRWPPLLPLKSGAFHWWYILPGLCGFLLVFLVPLMIKHMGAFPVILTMLLGQVTTGFLWDVFAQGSSISMERVLGLLLAMAGAYLSFKPVG